MRTLSPLKNIMPEPWVSINPAKANELKIVNGDMVFVESERGILKLKAKVTEEVIDPETVFMPYGWGQPYTGTFPVVNTITPDTPKCPISTSTANHSFLCRIKKA